SRTDLANHVDERLHIRFGRAPVDDGRPEGGHSPVARGPRVDTPVAEELGAHTQVEGVELLDPCVLRPIAEADDVEGDVRETLKVGRLVDLSCEGLREREVRLDRGAMY